MEELRLVEATGVEAMEVLLQGMEEDIRVVSLRELLKDLLLVQTHSKCNYLILYLFICVNTICGGCRLWQWFSSVDADRSGAITAQELQQCLINGDWSR